MGGRWPNETMFVGIKKIIHSGIRKTYRRLGTLILDRGDHWADR